MGVLDLMGIMGVLGVMGVLIVLILLSVVVHKLNYKGQRQVVTYDGIPGTEMVETGSFIP